MLYSYPVQVGISKHLHLLLLAVSLKNAYNSLSIMAALKERCRVEALRSQSWHRMINEVEFSQAFNKGRTQTCPLKE